MASRKKLKALLVSAALVFAVAGSGSLATGCSRVITPAGERETETREVAGFDHVVLSSAGKLTIKPGKTASLEITADKNIMPYITSEVQAGELEIAIDTRGRVLELGGSDAPEYVLTAPSITALTTSGSGDIMGGPFSGGLFTIVVSGSGGMDLDNVDVLTLDTTISGSGSVAIAGGVTGAQVVNVSGSGSFSAPDLESRVATVKVSGSGDVEVWATEGLAANVSGSGTVSYWGSPGVTEEVGGSGEVKSLGKKGPSGS